ncbi:hypothetical protein LQW54_010257 [Pestalotiopsis sp. IQ-011]
MYEVAGTTRTPKAIIFDLDKTLFDHDHALRCANSAVQSEYASLAGHAPDELLRKYNAALEQAYDGYLDKAVTYEEADLIKVRLFFAKVGLPEPTAQDVARFRAAYKPAYRAHRRATPGDAGQRRGADQEAKAAAIGVRHLADRLIASQEPDPRIFRRAADALDASPGATYMVGDSPEADIEGALDAGLRPVLYDPHGREEDSQQRLLFGRQVPVIRHMSQILELVGIDDPS